MENSAPQDNHSYCRLFKELGLEMTGYGPSLFGNRLVRTRMPGGVEAGGEKPPAIRLTVYYMVYLIPLSGFKARFVRPPEKHWVIFFIYDFVHFPNTPISISSKYKVMDFNELMVQKRNHLLCRLFFNLLCRN